MVNAFTTAQWVKVDKSVQDTVITGLLDTFEKKDYLTMPMSTLYLFGRPQDYSFAHGEAVRVVMSRNHFARVEVALQGNRRRVSLRWQDSGTGAGDERQRIGESLIRTTIRTTRSSPTAATTSQPRTTG